MWWSRWVVARVPEPRRGGENDLPGRRRPRHRRADAAPELVEEQGVEAEEDVILEGDVSAMPLRPAIEYVMHVRTVVMIIIASALGDVFFTALQVFGVLFLVDQFGISASTAAILIPLVGVGGFVGVLAGGRGGDLLIERGVLTGRINIGVWSYLAAAIRWCRCSWCRRSSWPCRSSWCRVHS